MGSTNHSFNKRQKERQRKEKAQRKMDRRQARKQGSSSDPPAPHDDDVGQAREHADAQAAGQKPAHEG